MLNLEHLESSDGCLRGRLRKNEEKKKWGPGNFFDFFAVGSADGRPPGDLTQVLGTGLLVLDLCQYLNLGRRIP